MCNAKNMERQRDIYFFHKVNRKMKKTKKTNNPADYNEHDIISRRTKRQQEKIEKERQKTESNRKELFKKRVRNASEQKVPKTSRTKAYYRFSKNYPSVVDHEGFRENSSLKEKMSPKGIFALITAGFAVFILTFFVIQVGIELSEREISTPDNIPASTEEKGLTAVKLQDTFFISDSPQTIRDYIVGDAVVVDIKNEEGFIHIKDGKYTSKASSQTLDNVKEKITELENTGIKTIAYISCFKDNTKPYEYTGMETMTSAGYIFEDSAGDMWLNPFLELSQEFILSIIKNAVECGFSYILLDNVCFPSDFSVTAPYYQNTPDIKSKNDTLITFINKATALAGSEKIILNCDITGICAVSELPNEKYGGTLLSAESISYSLDMRADRQYTSHLKASEYFRYIEEMPLAFILDAGILARQELIKTKEAYVLFALTDTEDEKIPDYADKADIGNLIIMNY